MQFDFLNYANCLIEGVILTVLWRIIDDRPFRPGRYALAYAVIALWGVWITLIDSVLFSLLPFNFLMVFSAMWIGHRRPFRDTVGRTLLVYLVLIFFQSVVLCVIPREWFGTNTGNFAVNGAVLALSAVGLLVGRRRHIQDIYRANRRMFRFFLLILCVPEILLVQTVVMRLQSQSSLSMLLLVLLQVQIITLESLAFSRKARQAKEQQLSATQKYISDMNRHLEESRRSIHDFNRHLRYLRNIVAERADNAELVTEVDVYCRQMLAIYEEEEILLQLDDPVLRAILYGRRTQAKANGFPFVLKATPVLPTFPLRDYQMVEVLDNLLDNAFEAVAELPEDARWIHVTLSARPEDDQTVCNTVCVENPCAGVDLYAITAGKHYTTKGGRHQGLGLRHVADMVKSTGGHLLVDCRNGVFTVAIEYTQKTE